MAWYDFWHTQKVLPATYDDSLSYYEVLTKVIDTLKELAPLTEGLDERITTAEATATAAQNSAAQAVSTATAAESKCAGAESKADTAAENANVALATATAAQSTAQNAGYSAGRAEDAAAQALSTANSANSVSAQALNTASAANSTANTAYTNAENAGARAASAVPLVDCSVTPTQVGALWYYTAVAEGWQLSTPPQQFTMLIPLVNGLEIGGRVTVKFGNTEYVFADKNVKPAGGYNWTGTPSASAIPHLVWFDIDTAHADGGGVVII